jgi:hypothetical protein
LDKEEIIKCVLPHFENRLINKVFRKDDLILIDGGEYSDYSVEGVFKVLKDFNPKNELISCVKKIDQEYICGYDVKNYFLNHLTRKYFIEEVDVKKIYLGSYDISNGFARG